MHPVTNLPLPVPPVSSNLEITGAPRLPVRVEPVVSVEAHRPQDGRETVVEFRRPRPPAGDGREHFTPRLLSIAPDAVSNDNDFARGIDGRFNSSASIWITAQILGQQMEAQGVSAAAKDQNATMAATLAYGRAGAEPQGQPAPLRLIA